MGSMFLVVVPVRDHEAALRQKELHLHILEKERVAKKSLKSELEGGGSGGRGSGFGSLTSTDLGSGSGTTTTTTTNLTPATVSAGDLEDVEDDMVDIYSAEADGAQVKIVVSEDGMQIIGPPGPGEKKGKKLLDTGKAEQQKIDDTIGNTFLEKHMENCLEEFRIMNACWGQSVDGNFSQVSFTVPSDNAEKIINQLQTVGIGKKYASSICVCAASVFYEPEIGKSKKDSGDSGQTDLEREDSKHTKWNEFVASIKSRLTVAQVVQSVKANAILTFDFIVLIVVAGAIAGLGLIDDSAVNVVASMLVSPLMGPIMAMTFGTVIRDWELIRIGALNELIGLSICLVVGYTFGICLQVPWGFAGPWAHVQNWPTGQMIARSETRALAVGVMVAIPSGAGVAISILAGNSGSLVGVAISASLLPPAVNCGILWGLATVIAVEERMAGHPPESVGCGSMLNANYTTDYISSNKNMYCKNMVLEYFFMGLNSFALTIINIVVIFVVGVVILKIKEVAPHTSRKSMARFWKQDIKTAREFNAQGKNGASVLMQDLDITGRAREDILQNVEKDQTFAAVNRRAPGGYASYNILTDVRHRNQLGSMENLHKPAGAAAGGGGGEGEASKPGWLGGWFSKDATPTNGATNPGDDGKTPAEGHGRRRPTLV